MLRSFIGGGTDEGIRIPLTPVIPTFAKLFDVFIGEYQRLAAHGTAQAVEDSPRWFVRRH